MEQNGAIDVLRWTSSVAIPQDPRNFNGLSRDQGWKISFAWEPASSFGETVERRASREIYLPQKFLNTSLTHNDLKHYTTKYIIIILSHRVKGAQNVKSRPTQIRLGPSGIKK
jgi:hypothetical protein